MEQWEVEVRRQVAEAAGKSSLAISNTLPEFLDQLAATLKGDSSSTKSLSGMGKTHGGMRALLSGYFLPQLLKEFSILRWVVNRELFAHKVSSFEVETIVNKVIDSAISQAATEFSKVQNEQTAIALKKAEDSNRDLEHFAAIAAHDLKSPLSTISGYLSHLEDEFQGELPAHSIQVMSRTAIGMNNLIDRLLEYARLGRSDLSLRPISLASVVESAMQNLTAVIDETQAEVNCGSLPTVEGDPQLLIQLFQNLIGNAIKFRGEKKPKIRIEAKTDDKMWQLSVSDNGIGFDPNEKEDIFALYKMLHNKSEYQGTGIGLATCRRVVESHGGKIWANSTPNQGSTFYFTLPRVSDDPPDYQ